jgi:acyl dehydratase
VSLRPQGWGPEPQERGPAPESLTGSGNYFEDFTVGERIKHARGTTVGELENQMLTKLVMNTAQAHFNEHAMKDTPFGQRLVFGLVTGSIVMGLAMQDIAENALAELRLDKLRFTAPVFHGDTLYAYTEVLAKREVEREDAGEVSFKHWGVNQDGKVVFEGERAVLVKRRSHSAKTPLPAHPEVSKE